jgi:ketosteroid isomerase-like protein
MKDIDTIYKEWNEALSSKNMEMLLNLYADDIVLESPLIPHLLEQESGVAEGKVLLRKLLEILFKTQPEKRQFYRKNYFTDGKTLMWEYPRLTPTGEQMDFAEIMEIKNGKIQKHRVYWGWYGVNVLKRDEHHANLNE